MKGIILISLLILVALVSADTSLIENKLTEDKNTFTPLEVFKGYRVLKHDANESIYYDVSIQGKLIKLIPRFNGSIIIEEIRYDETISIGDKKRYNESPPMVKVKYTMPSSVKVTRKDKTLTPSLSMVDNTFSILATVLYYKFGTDSIIVQAETGYASNDTNVTQDFSGGEGCSHLNMSNKFPYNETRGYWNYDCGNATVTDFSKFDNNGLWNLFGNEEIDYSNGVYNRSVLFDWNNSDDYFSVADDNSLDFGTSQNFTIATWVNADSISGTFTNGLINKFTLGVGPFAWPYGTGYGLALNPNTNQIVLTIADSSVVKYCQVSTDSAIPLNSWQHAVGTVERADECSTNVMKIYVNGTEVPTSKTAVRIFGRIQTEGNTNSMNVDNSDGVSFGLTVPSQQDCFDGELDDSMIIGALLTASDVSDLYNNQSDDRFMKSGVMNFSDVDFGTNNSVNVTLGECGMLVDSNLSVFGDCYFDKDTCKAVNCLTNGKEDLEIWYHSDGFYSSIIAGNITWEGGIVITDSCSQSCIDGYWIIDCNDKCKWIINENIVCNVTMTGNDEVKLFANWTLTGTFPQRVNITNGCTFNQTNGGKITR